MYTFRQARAVFAVVAMRSYSVSELVSRLLLLGYTGSVVGRSARSLAMSLSYVVLPQSLGERAGKPTPVRTPVQNRYKSVVLTSKDIGRFWSKVDMSRGSDACWPWLDCLNSGGYGYFGTFADGRIHTYVASRIAFVLAGGVFDDGPLVLHKCDSPSCCNPAHLFAGTHRDNSRDAVAKGRWASGDPSFGARMVAARSVKRGAK